MNSAFLPDTTLLQYLGRLIGVIIDRTHICHPDLSGEGIEYCPQLVSAPNHVQMYAAW
jgi:hypothetical protein